MRRLIHLTFTLLLAAFALAPFAHAAGAPTVHALLIAGSKGGGASDPRLAKYEANLKSSMPFDTFKLLGEGSGNSVIALPNGHRVQLSEGERSGNSIKVRIQWTQGGNERMNTQFTLTAGSPAILGRSGEFLLLIAN